MGDIQIKLDHSNLCDVVLRRIRKMFCKKKKRHYRRRNAKMQNIFEGKKRYFYYWKSCYRCNWKMLILEKKLGYNHDDIIVREQTSIAEKIIKLFPYKNIVLNKQLKGRKPDIQFKDLDLIVEVEEGNHEDDDTDDEKEREDMFKRYKFKTIKCNQNDPGFDINKFLGEIISYVTKLREKKQWMRWLIKLQKTEKIVAVAKSKELKRYAKNILPGYKEWKTHNQK